MKDHLTTDELGALLGGRVESIQPLDQMQIDKEHLKAEIASLQKQRNDAMVTVHQADGAIAAYAALIARLESESPADDQDNAATS